MLVRAVAAVAGRRVVRALEATVVVVVVVALVRMTLRAPAVVDVRRTAAVHGVGEALWFHIVPVVVPRVVQVVQIFRAKVVDASHVVLVQLVQHVSRQRSRGLLLGRLLTVDEHCNAEQDHKQERRQPDHDNGNGPLWQEKVFFLSGHRWKNLFRDDGEIGRHRIDLELAQQEYFLHARHRRLQVLLHLLALSILPIFAVFVQVRARLRRSRGRHWRRCQRLVEQLLDLQRVNVPRQIRQLHKVIHQYATLAEAVDANLLVPFAQVLRLAVHLVQLRFDILGELLPLGRVVVQQFRHPVDAVHDADRAGQVALRVAQARLGWSWSGR
uniref:(northern house mosquito) hypothetical protein n=1 Tax=Culex pipiens TaxID=7175 RepID=A0A8D8KEC7_CULPI